MYHPTCCQLSHKVKERRTLPPTTVYTWHSCLEMEPLQYFSQTFLFPQDTPCPPRKWNSYTMLDPGAPSHTSEPPRRRLRNKTSSLVSTWVPFVHHSARGTHSWPHNSPSLLVASLHASRFPRSSCLSRGVTLQRQLASDSSVLGAGEVKHIKMQDYLLGSW